MASKFSKANRLAVEALLRQRQAIAFDANVHKIYGFGGYAERCAKQYDELTAAIAQIEAANHRPQAQRQLELFEEEP